MSHIKIKFLFGLHDTFHFEELKLCLLSMALQNT